MIPGIVGFSGPLFDDDPFGISPAAADLRVDIILPVATGRKTAFPVLEIATSDIAGKWVPSSLFQLREEVVRFFRRCCKPRRIAGFLGEQSRNTLREGVLAEVGSGEADRRNEDDRAAQGDEHAEEPELPPLTSGHWSSPARMCGPDGETVAFSFCEGQTPPRRFTYLPGCLPPCLLE